MLGTKYIFTGLITQEAAEGTGINLNLIALPFYLLEKLF
jgi:hypothetical protein